jgi:exosome complex RNA-binding protein Rrp42 (RNase PH superfamily)
MLSMGIKLQTEAAKAISSVEIFAARNGGFSGSATKLHAFFTACAAAVASLRDTAVPTVSARNQTTGANVVRLTTSEPLDPKVIPPLTSFVTAPARTITDIHIEGNVVYVEYTGASLVNANTIAYTQPGGANKLMDNGGNLLATFAATAIVVA